jgi:hypothetical protein
MLAVGFISSDISREDREGWAQVCTQQVSGYSGARANASQIFALSASSNTHAVFTAYSQMGTYGEEAITFVENASGIGGVVNYAKQFNDITTQLQSINTNLSTLSTSVASSGGGSNNSGAVALSVDNIPMVSVTVNANFDVPLSVYDDMQSGTSSDGKVQVVNSTVGDNLVHLKGRLSSVGIFQYKINGKVFNISVIENPTATNVVVRLE